MVAIFDLLSTHITCEVCVKYIVIFQPTKFLESYVVTVTHVIRLVGVAEQTETVRLCVAD